MKKQNWFFVIALAIAVMMMGAGSAFAQNTLHWIGTNSALWDGDNWDSDADGLNGVVDGAATQPANGDIVVFTTTAAANQMTTCELALTGIIVQVIGDANAPCGIDANGNDLEIASITMDGAAAQTLTINDTVNAIVLSGAAEFAVGASTLIILADITNTPGDLTISGAGNTTFSGDLIGANDLIKNGTGELTLDTVLKALTGDITLNAGTLTHNIAQAINAAGTFNLAGGIFKIDVGLTNAHWPTAVNITADGPEIQCNDATETQVAIAAGNFDYTISGSAVFTVANIANTGTASSTLTYNGSGTLDLTMASAALGPLTLTAGTIDCGHTDAIDTYTDLTLTSGTLLLSASPTGKWPTTITIGGGTPVIDVDANCVCDVAIAGGVNSYSITGGANTLELTAANTGSGTLTVNEATVILKLSVAGAATGPLTLTDGTIEANHATAIDTYSNLTLTAGDLIITTGIAAGAWPTAISIGAGTPVIDVDAVSVCDVVIAGAANAYSVTGGSSLELTAANTGSGTITVNEAGATLKLSVASAQTGDLTLTAGTIDANHATAIDTYGTLLLTAGTLKITTAIAAGAWPTAISIGAGTPIIQNDAATTVCDVALATGANDFSITGGENIEIKAGVTGGGAGALTVNMTAPADIVKFTTVDNTNTGLCTVTGGTVLFNNTNASAVTVGAAGVLGGTGTVTGAIIVNGTLAPGDPGTASGVGELTAGATVVFNNNSVFELDVVHPNFDELTATGNVTINANPTLQMGASTGVASTSYIVATAAGGIADNFTDSLPVGWTYATTAASVTLTCTAVVIPTLNEWGIIIAFLLLAGAGFMMMRKRKAGSIA